MRGIGLMCAAIAVFTVMTALIKAAAVPAGQAVFFRSFFALPVIGLWLWAIKDLRDGLKTVRPWNHVIRGTAGTMAMGLGFAGLAYLPLPEVTAIRFATPIMIVIFAALILGEKFRAVRMVAVFTGLIGVMIVMWPRLSFGGGDGALFGAVVTLASAALAALAQIFVKSMAGTERTAAIVFYFSVTAAVLSLVTIPFGWVWPTGAQLALLIGAGFAGGVGQICLTSSYRFAEASTLAPFTYTGMIWALIIGYFVFSEVPTMPMLLGAGLVILSGIAIVLREQALGLKKTAQRKLMAAGK
ncbi:DMT family transporter [Alphaproteobacteria bacterium KMM 3653]|uniref:DMT family transporter n=1 Tax=Harenicola maris TaxID=2841044 RepID=A0AAP2CNC9_9RHOB|nr:DMT family transporter [Harenicola maris]